MSQPSLFEEDLPAAPATHFAEIVFDRPHDCTYTYAVPQWLLDGVAVGKRVRAPFGKGNRAAVGFCVGLTDKVPEREVKELAGVLDDETLLTDELLRLTRWMADYYLCGWGQVLNAVLPAAAKRQAGMRQTSFLEAVPDAELPVPLPRLSAKQAAAFEMLRTQGKPVEVKRLARSAQCGMGPLDGLVEKHLARRVKRRVDRFEDSPAQPADIDPMPTLTADQQAAWDTLRPAMQQGGFQPFLLYGVTGSGKTELYLRAIEEVVKQGKQALVLVPEISLTPQTIKCFKGRCGEVAVLHSHLQGVERGGHWRRVFHNQVGVIVGARSGVFAPTRQLGLIVIDEEHEGSFKQENVPRYHARDVAVMRARLENVPIILGSATPSLESWHNAQRGTYQLLRLPNRIGTLKLPPVTLIDQRHDFNPRTRWHALTPSLESAMRQALGRGGQVILLLNRRGFSTHLRCPGCGYVEQCKFCDLAVTFHKERGITLCHHCGYEAPPPTTCPKCDQRPVRFNGLGTEKLLAEVEEKFAGVVVRRMDSDTMKRPGSHGRLLGEFRRGEVHILLGTQMIAKGLDFPNVTLVGVINADVGLHLPDFRASERTFQLLSQVSGRTGRGPSGGRVLIQTYNPEHASIALAATHDFERFASLEMAHRQQHKYPPYQRLVRLIVRSRDKESAGEFADRLLGSFEEALQRLHRPDGSALEVRLLGPAECPVFRLKGYYRFHFQLQSPSPGALHQLLRAVLPTVRPTGHVEVAVDVDPQNML